MTDSPRAHHRPLNAQPGEAGWQECSCGLPLMGFKVCFEGEVADCGCPLFAVEDGEHWTPCLLHPENLYKAIKIPVSGVSYRTACASSVSDIPRDQGWPAPTIRKAGVGIQVMYDGDIDLARRIAAHLYNAAGDCLRHDNHDQAVRKAGHALSRDGDRIWAHIEAEIGSIYE